MGDVVGRRCVVRKVQRYTTPYGVATSQGYRQTMEDFVKVTIDMEVTTQSREGNDSDNSESSEDGGEQVDDPFDGRTFQHQTNFFAVFDGHGGDQCALWLTQSLTVNVMKSASFNDDLPFAIRRGFRTTDAEFLKRAHRRQLPDGSTAATVFQRGNNFFVANVGDSRVIVCSNGRGIPLSIDHKPKDAVEESRIRASGGFVAKTHPDGPWRVNGVLALSRAFGDVDLKPAVTAEPDLFEYELLSGDSFLVLATDGLWDVLSNQDVADCLEEYTLEQQRERRQTYYSDEDDEESNVSSDGETQGHRRYFNASSTSRSYVQRKHRASFRRRRNSSNGEMADFSERLIAEAQKRARLSGTETENVSVIVVDVRGLVDG